MILAMLLLLLLLLSCITSFIGGGVIISWITGLSLVSSGIIYLVIYVAAVLIALALFDVFED